MDENDNGPASVIAMCAACKQGFVLIGDRRKCFRCKGSVIDIEPLENRYPFVRGHTVLKGVPK